MIRWPQRRWINAQRALGRIAIDGDVKVGYLAGSDICGALRRVWGCTDWREGHGISAGCKVDATIEAAAIGLCLHGCPARGRGSVVHPRNRYCTGIEEVAVFVFHKTFHVTESRIRLPRHIRRSGKVGEDRRRMRVGIFVEDSSIG